MYLLGGACLLTLSIALGACTPGEDAIETPAGSDSASMPAEVQAKVDSGNLAYRADDFESALAYFRSALEDAPDRPAPLYGVYLAATELGDSALADSAAAVLQETAPFLMGSMGHPTSEESGDPHAALFPMADPDSQADTIG